MNSFDIARLPALRFGSGRIGELAAIISQYGTQALLVTGQQSFRASPHWQALLDDLHKRNIGYHTFRVTGEPSPSMVDQAVRQFATQGIEVVVGIGGGSALDAAKAIAGLLKSGASVLDYLEGVGKGLPYTGPALPLIAVPTTAGTGSEATKNAVLSEQGPNGYKKSFRHDSLVAQVALIDPALLATCPPALIAGDGMDAFTQLLESYVSTRANPMTDALALSGLQAFVFSFFAVWEQPDSPAHDLARAQLAYASWLSGITLAQAGLGSVHGLASPLGAFFPSPHGVVCGTLVAEATAVNIAALQARQPDAPALAKYAQVAGLIKGQIVTDQHQGVEDLVATLRAWTERLHLPRLREFGMSLADVDKVVAHSRGNSMQTNPIVLTDAEIRDLVMRRW